MSYPTLFISHGAPDLPLRSSPATSFLQTLGQQLAKPQAVLVISAHWNTEQPTASSALQPETIYDFGGFPSDLYRLSYPSPGAPKLAERVVELLQAVGLESFRSDRGLDHGAWSPLLLMYPAADIPVTQLSIQPHLSPAHHLTVGRALQSLRQESVLIVASGSATHNLRKFGRYAFDASPTQQVTRFSEWLTRTIQAGDEQALLNYRRLAPDAGYNHPTGEHLLPLFVALGAGSGKGIELHSSYTYGVLSMAAYAFE